MWQQWINLLAGLWLILSAYLGFTPAMMVTNLTVTGVIVAALGLWGALEHNAMHKTAIMGGDRLHRHA